MTEEPMYPRVLKQKMGGREIDLTVSTADVWCGGIAPNKSPRHSNNVAENSRTLLGFFREISNFPHQSRPQVRSVSPPLPKVVTEVKSQTHISPQKPQPTPRHVSPSSINWTKRNQRHMEGLEKEVLSLKTLAEENKRNRQAIENQNFHLRSRNQQLERQRTEDEKVIKLHSQKCGEMEVLRQTIVSLNATVFNQRNIIESLHRTRGEEKRNISELKQPAPHQIVSDESSHTAQTVRLEPTVYTFREREKCQSSNSLLFSSQSNSESSLEDEVRKLRSVYEKERTPLESKYPSPSEKLSNLQLKTAESFFPEGNFWSDNPSTSPSGSIMPLRARMSHSEILRKVTQEESEGEDEYMRTM